MTLTIERLPAYPSTPSRKRLAPSKLLDLNRKIATTLGHVLALPPSHQHPESLWNFVSSYAKDTASQIISGLIWPPNHTDPTSGSKDEGLIYKRTLQLSQQLVSNSVESSLGKANKGLDLQVLVDLAVVYGSSKSTLKGIKSLFQNAFTLSGTGKSNTALLKEVEMELVPAFTMLLVPSASSSGGSTTSAAAVVRQGLNGIRKISHCVLAFLRVSPPAVVLQFANNREFMLALANTYDQGLATIAHNYGGIRAVYNYVQSHSGNGGGGENEEKDWERLCVESKVDLIDAFHILFKTLIDELTRLANSNGSSTAGDTGTFAVTLERTFGILFDLLELPASSSFSATSTVEIPPTPFLNRSLLADYQQSYSLAKTLTKISEKYEEEKDARLDILEHRLQALGGDGEGKNPGALKIMLRSSGMPPGIDNLGKGSRLSRSDLDTNVGTYSRDKGKGKAKASAPAAPVDPDLDIKVTQVLDIFADYAPDYIRALLIHPSYPFRGNPESVIAALLDGTAPSPEELESQESLENEVQHEFIRDNSRGKVVENEEPTFTRQNVFDDTPLDMSMFRVGKKTDGNDVQDREYIEQMKADILRRAEEISSDEEDEESGWADPPSGQGRSGAISFDDDDEDGPGVTRVKVLGDGEESSDDEEEHVEIPQTTVSSKPPSIETILELAYIRDPNVFNRDAPTRRSKPRAELREKTEWADEQIEGWRIMLERNPKKDKILAKHEFSINQNHITPTSTTKPVHASGSQHQHRGGRGGRGGRGRGGGRGGNTGGDGGDARERAWKDKNKASRANHNRKRGHDKKMARAGGPSA